MKPALQEQIMLYTLLGEAICQIQILEQALTHCLTLKLNPDVAESVATTFLLQQQRNTFGTAVRLAAKKALIRINYRMCIGGVIRPAKLASTSRHA